MLVSGAGDTNKTSTAEIDDDDEVPGKLALLKRQEFGVILGIMFLVS